MAPAPLRGGWRRVPEPSSGDVPAAHADADAEADAPRTPLPSAITVDRGQQRYTTGGEDWVTLQVPEPGFYLLEVRSFAGSLTLSLHHDRNGPAGGERACRRTCRCRGR